jgi:putative spermidine/putrescine transport system permease protein
MERSLSVGASAGAPAAARRRELSAGLLLGPASVLILVTLVAPLALLFRYSLDRFDPTEMVIQAVTAANYAAFIADPFYLGVLRLTIEVAAIVTLLCLLFGAPIAYRLARTRSPAKSAMVLALILPLFMGATARTVGWMILFAHGGMLSLAASTLFGATRFDLMYTPTAVVVGIVSFNLPYMVLMLQAVFERIDPSFEEAAASLGAAPGRAFRRVVWPLSLPGLSIATILCFILSMNAYATPVLLGGPRFHMMAPQVYTEFADNNNWPFAAAIAFILMATTILLAVLANRLIPERYRAP